MKTITLEILIPDWAKWVAQDDDGVWWAHKNKPRCANGEWISKGDIVVIMDSDPNPNWRETLRRVE